MSWRHLSCIEPSQWLLMAILLHHFHFLHQAGFSFFNIHFSFITTVFIPAGWVEDCSAVSQATTTDSTFHNSDNPLRESRTLCRGYRMDLILEVRAAWLVICHTRLGLTISRRHEPRQSHILPQAFYCISTSRKHFASIITFIFSQYCLFLLFIFCSFFFPFILIFYPLLLYYILICLTPRMGSDPSRRRGRFSSSFSRQTRYLD